MLKTLINKYKEIATKVSPDKVLSGTVRNELKESAIDIEKEANKANIDIADFKITIEILNKSKLSSEDKNVLKNIEIVNTIETKYQESIDKNKPEKVSVKNEKSKNKKAGEKQQTKIVQDDEIILEVGKETIKNDGNKCEAFRKLNINIDSEEMTADILESAYDNGIDYYNKFNQERPMAGVSKEDNSYRVRHNNIKQRFTTLQEACDKMKENLLGFQKDGSIGKPSKFLEVIGKTFVKCVDILLVVYYYNNELFFDIRHLTFLMEIVNYSEKIAELRPEIAYCLIHKNKYGGYVIRELIPEAVMLNMFMQGQTSFAKKFRKDICEILIELRNDGIIGVDKNGKISKIKTKSHENNTSETKTVSTVITNHLETTVTILEPQNRFIDGISKIFTDHSNDTSIICSMMLLYNLISNGSKIELSKYFGNSVMYFYLTNLIDENNPEIIVKIGFTTDIVKRHTDLKRDYKCSMFLCGLKFVKSIQDEQRYHKMMEDKHPYAKLIKPSVNNKIRDEMYKLSNITWQTFCMIQETQPIIEAENNLTDDQIGMINDINNQMNYYVEIVTSNMFSFSIVGQIPTQDKARIVEAILGFQSLNMAKTRDENIQRYHYMIACEQAKHNASALAIKNLELQNARLQANSERIHKTNDIAAQEETKRMQAQEATKQAEEVTKQVTKQAEEATKQSQEATKQAEEKTEQLRLELEILKLKAQLNA